VALAALLLTLPGCKERRKPVFPVRGKVLDARGKPAAGALLTFHPAGAEDPGTPKPVAKVEEDGSFSLTTYAKGDGAPEGEYTVTLTWPAQKKTPFDPEGGDRLKGAYANPRTSTIRFTVQQGENEVPPIQLR
jgi:hypothetical protein